MLPNPDDLTPAEVAALCRRPVKTIHDWLRAGRLRGRKIGPRLWAVPRAELEVICSEPVGAPPAARSRRRQATAARAERGKAELRKLGLMS